MRKRKLNVDKMRHHKLRDTPDEVVKIFPASATTREFNAWIKPWMQKMYIKHREENIRLECSSVPILETGEIKASARVVFVNSERKN